ncbi:cyclophilin-like protein [Amylocystis lapponica]|nr:cyclophilin-like protein [Amylocystis lapponica]
MEGYYDGVIFHRIVPGFLIQTGDKTGTGGGGESFYGEPFEDEIHPRLRFPHRGLVAMANNGSKNSNDSQFIITLDRADELHGKHTLFGRVVGDTIYNVMKIGEMEIDANERPVYPPKIKGVRIIDNPFDDIVPRITAEEKRVQQRAREKAQREREEEQRRRGAKKNVKLLSFGADADQGGEEETVTFKKKAIVRPDLVDNPEMPIAIPDLIPPRPKEKSKSQSAETNSKSSEKKAPPDSDLSQIRVKHAQEQTAEQSARAKEIARMEADIRKLARRTGGGDASDDEPAAKRPKHSVLAEEMARYAGGRGVHKKGKRRDEGDILAALDSFRSTLKRTAREPVPEPVERDAQLEEGETEKEPRLPGEEDPGMEVDDDTGFLGHALTFPKDNNEEVEKAERDYEVIDPRQRGARAKEEERERKRALKAKDGRKGYRR